jgi:hypothetical protein
MTMRRSLVLALAILFAAPVFADESSHDHASPAAQPAPQQLYGGLGDVHHPVTTKSAQAQKYFDEGLPFNYGFNHDEG